MSQENNTPTLYIDDIPYTKCGMYQNITPVIFVDFTDSIGYVRAIDIEEFIQGGGGDNYINRDDITFVYGIMSIIEDRNFPDIRNGLSGYDRLKYFMDELYVSVHMHGTVE
jgi:hypothetical protein